MEEPPPPPSLPPPPTSNPAVYLGIIGMSALLCFAWILTGSVILTLMIIVLGGLHLAQHFPEAEQFISHDPSLLILRRFSAVIVVAIFSLLLAAHYLR